MSKDITRHLERKVNVPKMKPPPDKHMFDSITVKLHTVQVKKRENEKKILKITQQSESICSSESSEVDTQKQQYYMDILRQRADLIFTTPMLKSWESKIVSFLPVKLATGYPAVLEGLLNEAKAEWYDHLHTLGIKSIIRDAPGAERQTVAEKPFRYDGKTEHRPKFLKVRKIIDAELSSTVFHPFVRLVAESSYRLFPAYALDFSTYRKKGLLTIDALTLFINEDIKSAESLVSHGWYSRICKWLKKPKCLDDLTLKRKLKFVKCAPMAVSLMITEFMLRSVDHAVEAVGNFEKIPMLKMVLSYSDDQFVLRPTFDDIYAMYLDVIKKITLEIGQNLMPLEHWLNVPYDFDRIPVVFNKWAYDNALEQVQTNLDRTFLPVKTYVDNLRLKYSTLYGKSAREEVERFLAEGHNFDESCEMIAYIRGVDEELTGVLENEYFDVGRINLNDAISGLKQCASEFIRKILEGMCLTHWSENKAICAVFEEIAERASAVPRNSTELVEQGEYCAHARSVLLDELRGRISQSLISMGRLIDMTSFSRDHVELNSATVNWLEDIVPILAKHLEAFETHKADMEENLVKRVARLNEDTVALLPYLPLLDDMDNINETFGYLADIRKLAFRLRECDDQVKAINDEEAVFKFPLSRYAELEEVKGYILPFYNLMYSVHRWRRSFHAWMDGPFERLERDVVERDHARYLRDFGNTLRDYKSMIKQQIADGVQRRFKGLVEDPDPMNLPAPMKLCAQAIAEIEAWRPNVRLCRVMCNPALEQRHWDEMSGVTGTDLTPDAGTTLRKLIDGDLWKNLDHYEVISVGATKELQLVGELDAMIAEWDDVRFQTRPHGHTGIVILTRLDDIRLILDDQLVKTIAMRGSAFVKPFCGRVQNWYEKIVRVDKLIDEWSSMQAQWLYFLPIFSSKEIAVQIPDEDMLFRAVDENCRASMLIIKNQPRVIESASRDGLLETIRGCSEWLQEIRIGFNVYLESKRVHFPRFFFLSNDEIFEILSQTEDPSKVRPHLAKCFQGICDLEFDDSSDITAMISGEGERVAFLKVVNTAEACGSVEKWLLKVEEQMRVAVRSRIEAAYLECATSPREEWILEREGLVVLCVSQIYWALDVTRCLDSNDAFELQNYYKILLEQINDVVKLIRLPNLKKTARSTLRSLIAIDVHAKDVVRDLIDRGVSRASDFMWSSTLRYYWEDEVCSVKMINAVIAYAYEYSGGEGRLAITPLTNRCRRTLISAHRLHLCGALEGPAGSGKTETAKDLARALAIYCVVFNCSGELDYATTGKFLKGLASSGAWVCFDEFNRIQVEVLSVMAQQLSCIVQAVRQKSSTFSFDGEPLELKPDCYLCITLYAGYVGRTELPENLRVLFRTVAMMVPDYAAIGEISLYAYGFSEARILSVKIIAAFRFCSELLSTQNHYDYGMRAVKAVLKAAGYLKSLHPDENEYVIILKAIKDANSSKFLSRDLPLFEGILSDLFSHAVQSTLAKPQSYMITEALKAACEKMNLRPVESFITKVIQTYEVMLARHGFMLVGDPCSGKSSAMKVLAKALEVIGHNKVILKVLNPKAVNMAQLYGEVDPETSEWSDGIVAEIFRGFTADDSDDRKWIVFDGPVDAAWIENLNTTLDDNRKLCLASSEVITMGPSMSAIFETTDLAQASPATVSRCGIVYLESQALGYRPFCESWVAACDASWREGNEEAILDLCDWLFPPALLFVRSHCHHLVTAGEMNRLLSALGLIEMCMDDAVLGDEDLRYVKTWIQASFAFGLLWGVGGTLDGDSRLKFEEYLKEFWRGERPASERTEKIEITVPQEGQLSDYYYLFKGKGLWKYWPEVAKQTKIIPTDNLQRTVIPTADTVKYMHLMDMHIRHNRAVLLIGPTATGKSFCIRNHLTTKLPSGKYSAASVEFTATTSTDQARDLILSKLYKRSKNEYGPPKGKRAVIFVDDLNMPAKDTFGAQPPLELLRLFFDKGYWYDPKTVTPADIVDTLFVGAIAPAGGSRQLIQPRTLRHFAIYSINEFSQDTITRIFTNLLQIGMKKNGIGQENVQLMTCMVSGTLDVYQWATKELRATPSKPHYAFNMRDVGSVVQGCCLIKKESVDGKKALVKLWIHEVLRVFYDRLADERDRNDLFDIIRRGTIEHFKESFEVILEAYRTDDGAGVVTEESVKGLIFCACMDREATVETRRYEEIPNIEAFRSVAAVSLNEYNSSHKAKVNIVLFDYALEHLSRVCRVAAMSGGNALLVGVSGSGRRSVARLAAFLSDQPLFQPEVTKFYEITDWREDLKKTLECAGAHARDTAFLFGDTQIKEELFVENINSLLNSGEVPNLFSIDEKQEILQYVRLAAQSGNRNLDITAVDVFAFFVGRCKEKLHMSLCFSPVGESFRARLRLYPSLVDCCAVDWFEGWPEDALAKVAEHYVGLVDISPEHRLSAVSAFQRIHAYAGEISKEFYEQLGRRTYVTPALYVDLINSFAILMNAKQEELKLAKLRYTNGLSKLSEAAEAVELMQAELNDLKPQLIVMAERSAGMMSEIQSETIEADAAAAQVREDQKAANAQAAAAQGLKAECEADLALALPILEDAIAALNTLKPTDITLVKSMKNPPAAIKLVMAAVCVIKSVPPDRIPDPNNPGKKMLDFWGPSKRILGDMQFLQSLKDFDKDNIPVTVMAKIRKDYLPHKDFKPHVIAKASTAAEGLCKWIIAMDMYDAVAKVVAPKKAKLESAEREFAATMKILDEKKAMVARLERRVRDLHAALDEANLKKKKLQDDVELCVGKLQRAEKLIGGLGGEKSRWTAAEHNLQLLFDCLPGDILLSCGIISYLAPYTMPFRASALENWKEFIINCNIPHSPDFDFTRVLGSTIKIQNWQIAGLPRDHMSTENAVILDNSARSSVMVDPQGQANRWLKATERNNGLKVIKFGDCDYMRTIEKCLRTGYPVLIECVLEEIEATLDPILAKNVFNQSGKEYIALGDEAIEYDRGFRLYMTSKLRNPHYMPEVFNKVTVINFSLTREGLEAQLLAIAVAKERPDLQTKLDASIAESAENEAALKGIEDGILQTLHETEGDILENEGAIEVLDSSKSLANSIAEKQRTAKQTQMTIEEFRLGYRPIALHSAVLYYCLTELPNVDPMYQFSLAWFIDLFVRSIESANKSKELARRLRFLNEAFTYNLYCNVCRSLSEKDKIMFSFLMCSKIMLACSEMNNDELKFMIRATPIDSEMKQNQPSWLSEHSWRTLCELEVLEPFEGFCESFARDAAAWREAYDSPQPHLVEIPEPWRSRLTDFQKLLVAKALRPDKLSSAILRFVETRMGVKYVSPPPFDIVKAHADSNCLVPLIFILCPGSDPMGTLMKYCEIAGFKKKFRALSLGQGQGAIACATIEKARRDGEWVCLQNCHLATEWLPVLERIIESLDVSNTDLSFRLWLTSYPSDQFPQSISQSSIKMTDEPSVGLRNSLCRSYASEPIKETDFFEGCPGKDKEFSKLLYGLCFFDAVVRERRRFGSLGWNVDYGFDYSDFQISALQLRMFLNDYEDIQYDALNYLTGECNYGGRVTDEWDRRLIVTLLRDFLNERVVSDGGYAFSNVDGCYGLPMRCGYADYVKYVEDLPAHAPTEVYGLNANAGIARDMRASMDLLERFSLVEGGGEIMDGSSDDGSLLDLCERILAKIPDDLDVRGEAVLQLEMERFNQLTAEMKHSLGALRKAASGTVPMSPTLEAQAASMLRGNIPERWVRVSYPSLKPLFSYVSDLTERLRAVADWAFNGTLPYFWLSGLFCPRAFLTSVAQDYAHKNQIPLDCLTFDFKILDCDSAEAAPEVGVYFSGPFADGARWDRVSKLIAEQFPKVLYEPMPLIWAFPVKVNDFEDGNRYTCPVYATLDRRGILSTSGRSSNYILPVMLPSDKPSAHWIKRSFALILQLNV